MLLTYALSCWRWQSHFHRLIVGGIIIYVKKNSYVIVVLYYCNSIVVDRALWVLPIVIRRIRASSRSCSIWRCCVYMGRKSLDHKIRRNNFKTWCAKFFVFYLIWFFCFCFFARWLINADDNADAVVAVARYIVLSRSNSSRACKMCNEYLCKSKNQRRGGFDVRPKI